MAAADAVVTRYVGLLRAVNVGGTGRLPMAALRGVCERAGFRQVRTLLASGNAAFESDLDARTAKASLESGLAAHVGKPIAVFVRNAQEIRGVLDCNPFADRPPNLTVAIFLDAAPPADALEGARGRGDELMALGAREIYVHYPAGMGRSQLRIPAAKAGTARNMNTIEKLTRIAETP